MIKKFSRPSKVSVEFSSSHATFVQLVSLATIRKKNHWLQICRLFPDIHTETYKSGLNVSTYKVKRLIATKANQSFP